MPGDEAYANLAPSIAEVLAAGRRCAPRPPVAGLEVMSEVLLSFDVALVDRQAPMKQSDLILSIFSPHGQKKAMFGQLNTSVI